MPTKRCDNQKAYATVNLTVEQLLQLIVGIIENKNISDQHLSNHERVSLAKNFISYIKKLWRFDCRRDSPLHNLSKKPLIDNYTKDFVIWTWCNNLRINNSFNHIIGYLNINSLRSKIDDLCKVCKNVQIDIPCVEETRRDSFPDIQFKIDGYQSPFLRRDRDNRGGIFIKPGLMIT